MTASPAAPGTAPGDSAQEATCSVCADLAAENVRYREALQAIASHARYFDHKGELNMARQVLDGTHSGN